MPVAHVQVAYINQPKPGKKRGSIKSADGVLYAAFPDKLSQVTVGGTYDLKYKDDEYQGVVYHVVEEVKSSTLAASPAAPIAVASRIDDGTPERIFVCGAINALLSNPNFPLADLSTARVTELVNNLRRSWAATFGIKDAKTPQPKNDMDGDAVPF